MLGSELVRILQHEEQSFTALSRAELDITDAIAVSAAVIDHDVVINAAAFTNVDAAEREEQAAEAVNGDGVSILANACSEAGAKLLHISTDSVFSGLTKQPYSEHAPTEPVNAYGRTKLAGEQAVLSSLPESGYVVRTAWLYGEYGRNFLSTILRHARGHKTIDVVDDQFGQPTWSKAVATQLVALGTEGAAGHAPSGVYHATSSGATSWYEFARTAFTEAGLDPERVRPITSDQLSRPARRPPFTVLNHDRWTETTISPLEDWRTMLSRALAAPVFTRLARAAREATD